MTAYKLVFEEILRKLDAETRRRAQRSLDEWILAERRCVWREVNYQRGLRALLAVDIEIIARAERLAVGHSDYVQKYAHAAAELALGDPPWLK